MTISSAMPATTELANSIVAEIGGSSPNSVEMMIGIGLVKDSEAVYFQYCGEETPPQALVMPSGKPVFNMVNIRVVGVSIVEGIGAESATKLNLFIETTAGRTLMLTSGIQTWWTQCVMGGLMGILNDDNLDSPFTLSSYRGKSGRRPVFASIYQDKKSVRCQDFNDQLGELRGDRAWDKYEAAIRDAVEILNQAVTGGAVEQAVVSVDDNTTDLF